MSNLNLRNITNSFLDVRLMSLASWSKAKEIEPRDHGGPYVVMQEGFDPEDLTMTPDEFVLGRTGKWLSIGYFYRMPVPDRRAEFVFGTAAEVMKVVSDLPAKVVMHRPTDMEKAAPSEKDEFAVAIETAKAQGGGKKA
jgi:hypothetical protein